MAGHASPAERLFECHGSPRGGSLGAPSDLYRWPAFPETGTFGNVSQEADPESQDPASHGTRSEGHEEDEGRARSQARLRRMLTDLFDSGQAIRKGSQDLVSGVAMATKEEALRIITSEVRGFLDKMDVADLMQQIVEGLVVDIHTTVRFERAGDGKLHPKVGESDTQLSVRRRGHAREDGAADSAGPTDAPATEPPGGEG